MVELKTPDEIEGMRAAGRVVAQTLETVRERAVAGVTLRELDGVAADVIAAAGAKPAFLHYRPETAPTPFTGAICASVNDAVVHGIPDDYALRNGDLVSIDTGAYLSGWCGDAAISFVIGEPRSVDAEDTALIATTEEALAAGIEAARPGNRIGDIAHAVASVARAAGYGILADHGGHGIGRAVHEDPYVPNEGRVGRGMKLRPGMALAIEPMLIADGTDDYLHDPDGWTLRTVSGARAAHVEHTIAITDNGPRILTVV